MKKIRISKRAVRNTAIVAGLSAIALLSPSIVTAATTAFVPDPCTQTNTTCLDKRVDKLETWAKAHTDPTTTVTVTASPTTTTTTAPTTSTTTVPTTTTTTVPTTTTTTTAPTSTWPDASNTGVLPGTTLTNRTVGTITTPGTVIENALITDGIRIAANDVIIRNSKIVSGSDYHVVKIDDYKTGVRLENVEIDGLGKAGTAGADAIYGPATIIAANIHGVENGIQPDAVTVLRDSWIHDLDSPGSPHIDGVQIDGGRSDITIEHNTIDLRGWTQTAAVMIDNYFGPVNNVTVNNNRLLGGGYTTYIDARFGRTQPADDTGGGPITNVRYTNNRIGYGQWGPALIATQSQDSYVWSGNVDDKTGAAIPAP